LSSEGKLLHEVYPLFEKRLSFEDFKNKFNSLKNEWNFFRALRLYQQAVKCGECNPNVGMVLLCSCADALQLVAEEKSKANFMKFYLKYCPLNLQNPPVEYYNEGKIPITTAPFDKVLRLIYKRFRCLYIHEGIGHLDPSPELLRFVIDGIRKEKDVYAVDSLKIYEWFREVTFESLFAML